MILNHKKNKIDGYFQELKSERIKNGTCGLD
jgi:hypothetical protein